MVNELCGFLIKLFILLGKVWDTHRRMLGPAFHPSILNSFAPTIAQHVDIMMDILKEKAEESIEITEFLFPCILDAIIGEILNIFFYIFFSLTNAHYLQIHLWVKIYIPKAMRLTFIVMRFTKRARCFLNA